MRVGADIIHPLVCKRFSGEALGYAFYFLIESEFQRCSGVFKHEGTEPDVPFV